MHWTSRRTVCFIHSDLPCCISLAAASPLAALFEQLNLNRFLAAFDAEEILESDLANVDSHLLVKLIPAAGPRSRLEKWIKDQHKPGARAVVLLVNPCFQLHS